MIFFLYTCACDNNMRISATLQMKLSAAQEGPNEKKFQFQCPGFVCTMVYIQL